MVAQPGIVEELITGRVEATNVRGAGGVKVAGAWHNVSKWANDADFPDKGETVTLRLDKAGYIRSIERDPGAARDAQDGPPPEPCRPASAADRERAIARQVALKAAVELATARIAAGGAFTSAEVLTVADAFAEWIGRP